MIAERHLLPRICSDFELEPFPFGEEELTLLIETYNRESGVRELAQAPCALSASNPPTGRGRAAGAYDAP